MGEAAGTGAGGGGGIPLALLPLLTPYRKHGHLSVRIERLPNGARLSRGTNNGDRTWSLRLDELDDLVYTPPQGADAAHNLAVRVLNVDGEHAGTLAVLDFPIAPGAAPASPPAPQPAAVAPTLAPPVDDAELRRLRGELGHAKASLGARDAELAGLRQRLEQAGADASKRAVDTELTAARSAWDAELKQAVTKAEAEAAASLAKARGAWQAEQEARIAEAERRAEGRIEQARQLWQQETQTAVAQAEARWKTEEASRLAAAEARWRDGSKGASAEGETRAKQAEARVKDAEARAKQAEAALAQVQAQLQAQMQAQAKSPSREELDAARERWQHETQSALAEAEASWKASEAKRIAAAEARGRDDSKRAVAEAKARAEAAEAALAKVRGLSEGDAIEIHVLKDDLQKMKSALTRREMDLAEARSGAGGRSAPEAPIHPAEQRLAAQLQAQKDAETRRKAPRPSAVRRLIRIAVLILLVVFGVKFYPAIEPLIREFWPASIPSPFSTGTHASAARTKPTATRPSQENSRLREGDAPL